MSKDYYSSLQAPEDQPKPSLADSLADSKKYQAFKPKHVPSLSGSMSTAAQNYEGYVTNKKMSEAIKAASEQALNAKYQAQQMGKVEQAGLAWKKSQIASNYPHTTPTQTHNEAYLAQYEYVLNDMCQKHHLSLTTEQRLMFDILFKLMGPGSGKSLIIELLYNLDKSIQPKWHLPATISPPVPQEPQSEPEPQQWPKTPAGEGLLTKLAHIMSNLDLYKKGPTVSNIGPISYDKSSVETEQEALDYDDDPENDPELEDAAKDHGELPAPKSILDATNAVFPDISLDSNNLCCYCGKHILVGHSAGVDPEGNCFHSICYSLFVKQQIKAGAKYKPAECPYSSSHQANQAGWKCPVCGYLK